jgi:hypothetical protein
MPFNTVCPDCGTKIKTPDNLAGKMVRCPKCEAEIRAEGSPVSEPPIVREAIQTERPSGEGKGQRIQTERRRDDESPPPERRQSRDRDDDDDVPRRRRRRRDRDDDDEDDDDLVATLIPTKNPKALIAYYLGVFSLIPILGLFLGPAALIFGILGMRYASAHPRAKGGGHAIAGIVLGSLTTLGHLVGIAIIIVGIISATSSQKRSENTDLQDRIAEIEKRAKDGKQPIGQLPIQPKLPMFEQPRAAKRVDLPPEPLFSANRNLLNPDQDFPVQPEEGLVASVRVGSLQVTRLVFAPDGKTLAVNTTDGNLLIELATSRTRPINGEFLAFSRDSSSLIAIRRQAQLSLLFLLDVATGETKRMLTLSSRCDAAQFSDNGRYFVAVIFDPSIVDLGVPKGNKVQRWSCDAWDTEPKTLLMASDSNFTALAFSPDGLTLAVSATEPKKGIGVQLLDPESGKTKNWLHHQANGKPLSSLAFSPNSKLLASAGRDDKIVIWDMETNKPKSTLTGHKHGLGSVVFSPKGDALASRGFDGALRLWDINTGKPLAVRENEDPTTPEALAFTPDGKLLVTGSNGLLKAWEVKKLAGS